MAIEITVPRLGWSMDEGVFVEWLKADGDQVAAGDMLFVLEGEKAAQEIESFDSGILALDNQSPTGGETVAVGQVLAHLIDTGETPPALPELVGQTDPTTAASRTMNETATSSGATRSTLRSSPRARRVAAELNVDWTTAAGTGRDGRIREVDVRQLAHSSAHTPQATPDGQSAAASDGRAVAVTAIRQTIAERMVAGTNQTAPVTLQTRCDATALVGARNAIKATDALLVPTYSDMVMYLTSRVLKSHAALQGQWRQDHIWLPNVVHMAFAVDTPGGMLAPVVNDCDRKSLAEVASQTTDLAAAARDRTLTAQQLSNGTFTITNLGSYGVEVFTPIINLPQSSILGLGQIAQQPAVVDGHVLARWTLPLSLTFDHRVIDGAPAARFLADLKQAIEAAAF